MYVLYKNACGNTKRNAGITKKELVSKNELASKAVNRKKRQMFETERKKASNFKKEDGQNAEEGV